MVVREQVQQQDARTRDRTLRLRKAGCRSLRRPELAEWRTPRRTSLRMDFHAGSENTSFKFPIVGVRREESNSKYLIFCFALNPEPISPVQGFLVLPVGKLAGLAYHCFGLLSTSMFSNTSMFSKG